MSRKAFFTSDGLGVVVVVVEEEDICLDCGGGVRRRTKKKRERRLGRKRARQQTRPLCDAVSLYVFPLVSTLFVCVLSVCFRCCGDEVYVVEMGCLRPYRSAFAFVLVLVCCYFRERKRKEGHRRRRRERGATPSTKGKKPTSSRKGRKCLRALSLSVCVVCKMQDDTNFFGWR